MVPQPQEGLTMPHYTLKFFHVLWILSCLVASVENMHKCKWVRSQFIHHIRTAWLLL